MKPIVSASIMCANLLDLGKEVSRLLQAGVDWLHIDVMDGHFVPNQLFGPNIVEALRPQTILPLDVHLMIEEPGRYIEDYVKAGADLMVIHQESTVHPHRVLSQIKEAGKKAGIALNPATDLSTIQGLLTCDLLDLILIMTVNPGFAGQKFIEGMIPKIKRLRQMFNTQEIDIQVDGGLTLEWIKRCAEAGANVFVAGTSSIFEKGGGLRRNAKAIIKQIHGLR